MRRLRVMVLTLVVVLVTANAPAWGHGGKSEPPKRVLVLVLDQLRPDYVDKFDMRNVKALMRRGASFDKAYLGHMASETVISHNVITSGKLPRNMGWSDEVYRDVDNVLGEGEGTMWITGSLTRDQFNLLIENGGYPKLPDYLHGAYRDSKYIVVGQKAYAAYSSSGPTGDITVTFSGRNFDCLNDGVGVNSRGPTGWNVPSYIAEPSCGRYYVNSASSLNYGTADTPPAWMYPLDGNRFVPGFDPAHLGGDVWVADAGMEMMEKEPWSGMLLTMGGIDKVSHMWGGITDDGVYPLPDEEMAHLRFAARTADDQVGRVVKKLRDLGQLDETLIVLTTDHAGQPATRFHGVNEAARSDFNWYYGETENGTFLKPSPSLAPLLATGKVRFTYQDSAIRTWLTDTSRAAKREAAGVMATLPDVIASYRLSDDGSRYRLEEVNWHAMTKSERRWWLWHGRRIVNTMAAPHAADVVGLLKDDTSYGVAGDHGGAQEPVQRIPIVFAGHGIGPRDSWARMRSVDILPTILREMRLPLDAGLDGRARRLP